jgi:uncharacterized protein
LRIAIITNISQYSRKVWKAGWRVQKKPVAVVTFFRNSREAGRLFRLPVFRTIFIAMTAMEIMFYVLLFLVAFLYASVGHGGASGYLALMALFNVSVAVMRPTALVLNLFVSLTSFIQFHRGKHFKWKIFLPFALASIPMSFVGGLLSIDGTLYKKILGLLLLIPVIRFWFFSKADVTECKKSNWALSLLIGGTIGFLSGLISIGGGIILSPILLMLKWTDQKQTAAISALFIFVNSISGLFGQLTQGIQLSADMFVYVVVAFAGGLAGAYFGALKFKQAILKNILAAALLVASLKLIFTGEKPKLNNKAVNPSTSLIIFPDNDYRSNFAL